MGDTSGERAGRPCLRPITALGALVALAAVIAAASISRADAASHPPLHWSKPSLIDPPVAGRNANLNDLSCSSKSLCVAVDQFGNAIDSTDPAAGAWQVTSADPGVALTGVSCPSASLCAATGGGDVITSTNPGAAAPKWRVASVDSKGGLQAIACPSRGLCVAVDDSHQVLSSTHPTAGPGAWKAVSISRKFGSASISCPSTSLCVISGIEYGSGSYVATSTNPAAGKWKIAPFGGGAGVSCPSKSFCAAATLETNVVVSRKPTGGRRAWSSRGVNGGQGFTDGHHLFYDVSCPSKSLCVAAGGYGFLADSASPTRRPSSWKARGVRGLAAGDRGFFYAVACPSKSLCVAGDRAGYATAGRG